MASVFDIYTPELQDDHRQALLTLTNPWQEKEVRAQLRRIEAQLHRVLRNDLLKIQIRVAEYTPELSAVTAEDKLKRMIEKNPNLGEMRTRLNMILD